MAIKNILLSSGSAKRWSAPENRFAYDTDTEYISIDNLSSSQFVLTGAISSVLINSGGIVTAYAASTNSGSYLVTDNTKWTVGSAGNVSIGPVSGTLSGSYPNPRFVDITYVDTGSLPVARGGFSGSGNFNLLRTIPSGSLIVANGTGSLTTISTASYVEGNDYVLASVSGSSVWAVVTASAPARDANVQYFTCSSPTVTTTGSWVKQNPNHQWARVMLQGGGGGGSVYTAGSTPGQKGGGGGGFTDIVVYVGNILSASITVGAGALGKTSTIGTTYIAYSSSFSASNIFISAGAGKSGDLTAAGGAAGGIGLTFTGGAGGDPSGESSAGAGGGGGGFSGVGGSGGLYTAEVASSPNPANNYKLNFFGYNIPIGFGAGGRSRQNGIYGSGGGGGPNDNNAIKAGDGGDGFVVVVSY
jgi:hypothetical protein